MRMKSSLNLFVCEQWRKGFISHVAILRYCVQKFFFGERYRKVLKAVNNSNLTREGKGEGFLVCVLAYRWASTYVYLWPLSILSGGTSLSHSFTCHNVQLSDDSTVLTCCFNSILLVTLLFVSPICVIPRDENESFPADNIQIRAAGINGRSWLQWAQVTLSWRLEKMLKMFMWLLLHWREILAFEFLFQECFRI